MSGSRDRARSILDGLGLLLLAAYVVVALIASRHGGAPGPLVALLVASAAALVAGRILGFVHRALIPAGVVAVGIVLALTAGPLVGGGPLGGPFGYRNATGAFCVQVAIAALMCAAATRSRPLRIFGLAAAVPFAVAVVADSSAAGVSLVVVAVAAIGLGGPRAVRASIVVMATLLVVTLAAVALLGARYEPGGNRPVERALTARRLVLWHESLQIMARRPGGVGAGRFQEVSPTAIRDPDARWAHNGFLQEGVELGWAGLALLVLVFLWGFARLWVHPSPDLVVALGAASLAALGIQACVDYVLHFPTLPLIVAALVGTAQTVPSRRSFGRDRDEHGEEGIEGGGDPAGVAGSQTAR